MAGSMKAMIVSEHGGPEVIKPGEMPMPEAGVGEVVVKVAACALNHLDVWVRAGIPGIKLPIILGCDVAGEVVALGPGVKHLQVGQKVMADPGLSCGVCKQCVDGKENICRQYHILGAGRNGCYAQFVSIPAGNCLPIPDGLDMVQAAAVPLVFITAWHMLISRVALQMNETVLVVGGGSGVGSAAIQIAKLKHARVIATVGDEEKAKLAKSLGADEIIIHSKEKIADRVKVLTDKQGVDVVFEHVGPAVFEDCLMSLSTGGRLVTCGATTGPTAPVDITRLFMKHQAIYGSIMGNRREFMDLLPFFAKGKDGSAPKLKPVIAKTFNWQEAAEAHRYMEARQHFGKIVLTGY